MVMRGIRRGRRWLRAAALTLGAAALMTAALAYALLLPELTQDGLKKKNGTVVDVGHADQGYIQVRHRESAKRLKLRISRGEETYTYDLNQNGEFEIFPLQMGSGSYNVRVFEQIQGTRYSGVSSISFSVTIEDELLPYLYPSQYVSFGGDSEAVRQAQTLCEAMSSPEEKAKAIERFVSGRFLYDYIKAVTVKSATTYLPDVDATLREKKGICFDFAALTCCMLRAQGIPAKLVIGYADQAYHAWNQAYIDGEWRLIDTTASITNTTVRRYTPERWY